MIALVGTTVGQSVSTPAEPMNFEVASVRIHKSGTLIASGMQDAGRVVYGNMSLMTLILQAYQVLGYQVSGPPWLDSERYDVAAVKPRGTTEEQSRQMLQNLLAERFSLRLHREPGEIAVYALTVGKRGPKFMRSDPATASVIRFSRYTVDGAASSMAGLAYILMRSTDRIVVDETGLPGLYDFHLNWAPAGAEQVDGTQSALLFPVLEEQLGLKLQAKKTSIEFLVIDHAEKIPIEN
jgi:uncharacterized protein (TIGR03435 family)